MIDAATVMAITQAANTAYLLHAELDRLGLVRARCRRRSIVNVGRGFSIYACHLCRSQCHRSTGTRGPGWRKDFKTPA